MTTSNSLGQSSSVRKISKQHFKICFCFKRMFKLEVAEPPEEIKHIFYDYSSKGTMSMDDLYKFLVQLQGEKGGEATKKHAQAIFDSLKHLNIFQRRGLDIEAFFRYLLGDLNGPLSHHGEVHHDMNSPLAHYFLYTGHNSYLTGNQITSDSSTAPIIMALNKGVRVIELDLWPNPREDDVEVRHGGTLTTPVELEACLKAIKGNAFQVSEYPVIITFEDHITRSLQAKVAKMVNRIFGDMLFRPDSKYTKDFPSPASLKKKILISTKPPEYPEDQGKSVLENSVQDKDDKFGVIDKHNESYDQNTGDEDNIIGYRNLIAIHAGKPKGGKENWLTNHGQARRLSLSEQELEEISRTHGTDIVRFSQTNLLRIYPKGTRVDSSNFNPMIGWMHGAQMVAFNMQGHGKYLRIMEGMFRANGGCGYVKKPDILLSRGQNNEVFDPRATRPVKETLQVLVYTGEGWHKDFPATHFDLYSPPDFFVKVGIVGVPADTVTRKTRTIEDQWVPVWNEEFSFPLTVPELAILRIKVPEHDFSGKNDFGGQICLPVSELRSGIRAVRLYDKRNQIYNHVRLLMGFQLVRNSTG